MLTRQRLKKLWNFPDSRLTVVLPATLRDNGLIGAGSGDMEALYHLRSVLATIYDPANISLLFEDGINVKTIQDDNLILIGGPSSNSMTKDALSSLKDRSELSVEVGRDGDDGYLKFDDGTKIRPEKNDLRITKDYGILIKTPSFLNPERLSFILAGVNNPGTGSAGALLTCPDILDELLADVEGNPFQLAHETNLGGADFGNRVISLLFPHHLKGLQADQPFFRCGGIQQSMEEFLYLHRWRGIPLEQPENVQISDRTRDLLKTWTLEKSKDFHVGLTEQAAEAVAESSISSVLEIEMILKARAQKWADMLGIEDGEQLFLEAFRRDLVKEASGASDES